LAGEQLVLEQETDYPWDGNVRISIMQAPARVMRINLRIPGWAESATISINGTPTEAPIQPGTYATISRMWSAGTVIEVDISMPPRLVQAHPKAEQLRNQVAVFRGPILYCIESLDLPEGRDLNNVYLPSDIALSSSPADDLPFGIQTLTGQGLYRPETEWGDGLYRPLRSVPLEPIDLRMIPYFAWANRGAAAMTVWLPLHLRTES